MVGMLLVHGTLFSQSTAAIDRQLTAAWRLRASQPDRALAIIDSALHTARALPYEKPMGKMHTCRGVILKNLGRYEQALESHQLALAIYEVDADTLRMARTYNRMGSVRQKTGAFDQAVDELYKSLDLYRSLRGTAAEQIDVFCNLAVVYSLRGEMESAITYYTSALELGYTQQDSARISTTLYNLATTKYHLKDYDSAAQLFEQCLAYEESSGNQKQMARIYNSLGVLREEDESLSEARAYYERSVKIFTELNDKEDLAYGYSNLGDIDLKQGMINRARENYERSFELAEELANNDLMILTNQNLALFYHKIGRDDRAWPYLNRQMTLSEVRFEENSSRQIQEVREKYEAREREEKIALLQKDLEIKQVNLEKERLAGNQKTWIGIALGLLVLSGALLALFYRQKWKVNSVITAQKEKLIRQDFIAQIREKEVESISLVIEAQKDERSRIASELHDGLGGLIGTLKLHLDGIQFRMKDKSNDERLITDFKQAGQLVEATSKEIRQIAHSLDAGRLSEFGLLQALEDLCLTIQKSGMIEVEWNTHELEERLQPHLEIHLYRAAQELVNNVLKHAQASRLSVQFIGHEEGVNLVIEDNGRGFSPEEETAQKGIGLKNLKDRIDNLNGEMLFDSTPGRGTTVVIDVPRDQLI